MRSALKIINVIHMILAGIFTFVFLSLLIVALIGKGPIVEDIWMSMRPHHFNEAGEMILDFAKWTPLARYRETVNMGTAENPLWMFPSQEAWLAGDAQVERIVTGTRYILIVFIAFGLLLGFGSFLCQRRMNDATRKTQFIVPIIMLFLSFNWVTAIMIMSCKRSTLINQHPYFE